MRIVVISDIHANYEALKVLVPHFRSSDKILCLGDIIGYSCAVNECIDILREFECVCIQGNHDRYLIEGTEGWIYYSPSTGKIVIDSYHPSARIGYEDAYHDMMSGFMFTLKFIENA